VGLSGKRLAKKLGEGRGFGLALGRKKREEGREEELLRKERIRRTKNTFNRAIRVKTVNLIDTKKVVEGG